MEQKIQVSLCGLDVAEVLSEQGVCCKNTRNDLLQNSRYVSVDVWIRMCYDVCVCFHDLESDALRFKRRRGGPRI